MKYKNDFVSRQPETLTELLDCITEQLEASGMITVNLADGDDLHELIESIKDGILGTETLNRLSSTIILEKNG